MKKDARVFCDECKYYRKSELREVCACPENKGTWRNRYEFREKPEYLNDRNDCKWFVPLCKGEEMV
jgi:hypothetical protein